MKTDDLKKTKIAGKITFNFAQHESFDIGDVDGHIISLRKSEGTNVSTGKSEFMDGAIVVSFALEDLVSGNGPIHGYNKLIKDGDIIISKWEGKIITVISAEGIPVTSFEGRVISWIKATGQYENCEGVSTFKGYFTSETSYVGEWEGEYWIKK